MIRLKPLLAPLICAVFRHKPTKRQDVDRGVVTQCIRCEKELPIWEVAEVWGLSEVDEIQPSALALKEVVDMDGDMSFGSRIEIPVQQVKTYQKRIEVKVLSKRKAAK